MSIRVVVLGVLFATFIALNPSLSPAGDTCPLKGSKESQNDCPWADIVRDATTQPSLFSSVVKKASPRVYWDMRSDALKTEIKNLWGYAVNYDEYAKNVIINHDLDRILAEIFQVDAPTFIPTHPGRAYIHSGIQHTYGYLFSNLETPFGYKRARWVQGTIEKGLGLELGLISPAPHKGSLFTNISYLAAKIAGIETPKSLNSIVPASLKAFKISKKRKVTVIETAISPRKAIFHTDFYLFEPAEQGALLVYSVQDTSDRKPKLITAFPVDSGFVDRALKSEIGKDVSLQLRYNAYLPELYGNSQVRGKRNVRYEKK